MNKNVKYCPKCSGDLAGLGHDLYQCRNCNHIFEIKEDKS